MSTPILCLLLFAAWTIALLGAIATARVYRVLTRQQAANSFASGVPHGGDVYWRLNRAHLNAVENLPIFASIVLAAEATGVRAGGAMDLAPWLVVGGRVVQSIVHISSNANMAVNVRFTGLLTQLGAFAWMILEIVSRAD